MKKLVIGFLIGAGLVSLFFVTFALGQTLSARSSMFFTPIDFFNNNGEVSESKKLTVGEIQMTNGVTCYVVSDKPGPFSVDNMTQLVGLGCVKE